MKGNKINKGFKVQSKLIITGVLLALIPQYSSAKDNTVIRLSTTTSTDNSGLMNILVPAFESKHKYKIDHYATGSGNALHRLRTGKADLTITHAPKSEQKLVNNGYGVQPRYLMRNQFVIVGPTSDPAGVMNTKDVMSALKVLSNKKAAFISRGDDSGTHKKELGLWGLAKIEPYGDWYIELGASMGKALAEASKEKAYTLTDYGTWLAKRKTLDLKIVYQGDKVLDNPYTVILRNPKKNPLTNHVGAKIFSDWLLSAEAQNLIGNYKLDNQQLFIPAK